jgi:hypothetical protein
MPPSLWVVLIQAAIPLGAELIGDIIAMIQKEQAKTLVAADWDNLATKWASKTAAQYLADAIAKSGAPV